MTINALESPSLELPSAGSVSDSVDFEPPAQVEAPPATVADRFEPEAQAAAPTASRDPYGALIDWLLSSSQSFFSAATRFRAASRLYAETPAFSPRSEEASDETERLVAQQRADARKTETRVELMRDPQPEHIGETATVGEEIRVADLLPTRGV